MDASPIKQSPTCEEKNIMIEDIEAGMKAISESVKEFMVFQAEVDSHIHKLQKPISKPVPEVANGEKQLVDIRSIYVGNVNYSATAKLLLDHFKDCGRINRVKILTNKFTNHPKGFAYIEFTDQNSVANAMELDESLFLGRQIKVMPKRTNVPGMCKTDRVPRFRPAPKPRSFFNTSYRGREGFSSRATPRFAFSGIRFSPY